MEHPKLIKFSTEMMLEIKELGRKLGMTDTNVIRYAVKKLVDDELKENDRTKNTNQN